MKPAYAFNLAFLAFAATAFTQPQLEWSKPYGGSEFDHFYAFRQTTDGGYIAAGLSYSVGGEVTNQLGEGDFWIIKTDADGEVIWQKFYGGTKTDIPYAIQQTTDGGYVVAGQSASNDGALSDPQGAEDCWVVKLDTEGNLQWEQSFGGNGFDTARYVEETEDGGYILVGWTASVTCDITVSQGTTDYLVVKLNASGETEWKKTYGGSGYDEAYALRQTADGGYIVIGSGSSGGQISAPHGNEDYWIVKLDTSGNIQWEKSLGGTNRDSGRMIETTNDGGYIASGYTTSNDGQVSFHHGSSDIWVVKINETGLIEWQRALGGASSEYALGTGIKQTSDGGYIVSGATGSIDGDVMGNHGMMIPANFGLQDGWIVKLSTLGEVQWQRPLGGSNYDTIYSVSETADGGYALAGGSPSDDSDLPFNYGDYDGWILKFSSTTNTKTLLPLSPFFVSIFPNPTSGFLHLTLPEEVNAAHATLTHADGTILYSQPLGNAGYLDISDLPTGVYSLIVTDSEGGKYCGKIVKQ